VITKVIVTRRGRRNSYSKKDAQLAVLLALAVEDVGMIQGLCADKVRE
jgi:hypothetical protein